MQLTEAEYIQKRVKEYIEELHKKYIDDPDNTDGMTTHLELDNPEMRSQMGLQKHHYKQSYWRWWHCSRAISDPKRWRCWSAALNMPAYVENSAVATGLEWLFSLQSPKKVISKNVQLPHSCTHLTCY